MNGRAAQVVTRARFSCFLFTPIVLAILTNTVSMGVVSAEEPTARQTDATKKTQSLIVQLDSKKFVERERAENSLLKLGESAVPPLLKAYEHKSPEIRKRAKRIVYRIEHPILLREFESLVEKPDAELDLDRGMWLIARILNPLVKFDVLDERLATIAQDVEKEIRKQVGDKQELTTVADADPKIVVAALKKVLVDDLGFQGNRGDYDQPKNSSLEYVLAERKGLPILLSHVVVSVAERVDLPIVGLSVPGQYMVKYDGDRAPKVFPKDDIVIDPYGYWREMTVEDLKKIFGTRFRPEYVQASPRRETLRRMMSNLRTDFAEAGDSQKVVQVTEYMRVIPMD